MQRKSIWIIILSLGLLGVCALMAVVGLFFIRRVGIPHFGISNIEAGIPALSASSDESKTIAVDTPARLVIDNPFGNVILTGEESKEIKIDMHRVAYGINQQAAEEALKKLTVNITQEGNTVTVKVLPPENTLGFTGSINFNISIPLDTAVTATLNNGELELEHLQADAVLSSDFGGVRVFDLQKGKLNATSKNGAVTASQILSEGQPVELNSDFGEVTLIEVNGGVVTATSKNGAISLENVKATGAVTLSSDFGEVSFQGGQAASLKADSKNGDINMADVKVTGPLTVQSDFGGITIHQVGAASYDLQNKNGKIEAIGASGSIQATSEFGDIDIQDGQNGSITLTTKNGSISYQGSLGKGPHTLTSEFGDVHLGIRLTPP